MAKIYVADSKNQADICVMEVDREYNADILVYIEDREYNAKDDENWCYVDRASNASTKIFWVDRDYNADLKVFFVDRDYQAKWKKGHKLKGRL